MKSFLKYLLMALALVILGFVGWHSSFTSNPDTGAVGIEFDLRGAGDSVSVIGGKAGELGNQVLELGNDAVDGVSGMISGDEAPVTEPVTE